MSARTAHKKTYLCNPYWLPNLRIKVFNVVFEIPIIESAIVPMQRREVYRARRAISHELLQPLHAHGRSAIRDSWGSQLHSAGERLHPFHVGLRSSKWRHVCLS